MMKQFIAMLALAFAALVQPAQAGTGMPLLKGVKTPTEIANLVDASLKLDRTGARVLDPARCKKTGSCATAQDYLLGIQKAHPSAKLEDVADLPRYLRSLVKKPAPSGEWHMSRLLVKGDSHRYDAIGWHRAFFDKEDVWYDVNTAEPILAGECNNVVGAPYTPPVASAKAVKMPTEPCLTVTIHPKVGDHIIAAVFTKDYLPPSACFKLIQGNRVTSLPAPCTDCDFKGVEEYRTEGYKPFLVTSFIAEAEDITLSYPLAVKEGEFGLCDTRGGIQSDAHFVKRGTWGVPTDFNVRPSDWPTWDRDLIGTKKY